MTRTIDTAMARAISVTHQDFQDRLVTLATMASLAPFIGFFFTLRSLMVDTFRGASGEKSQIFASTAKSIAVACIPSAFGIVLGLVSLWAYRHLQRRLDTLDREMNVTAAAWMDWFRVVTPRETPQSEPELKLQALDDRGSCLDSGLSAILLFGLAWSIHTAVLFWFDHVPIESAPSAAFWRILPAFLCSFLVVYAIWADLLQRKRSKVVVIAAALSLVWSTMRLALSMSDIDGAR